MALSTTQLWIKSAAYKREKRKQLTKIKKGLCISYFFWYKKIAPSIPTKKRLLTPTVRNANASSTVPLQNATKKIQLSLLYAQSIISAARTSGRDRKALWRRISKKSTSAR